MAKKDKAAKRKKKQKAKQKLARREKHDLDVELKKWDAEKKPLTPTRPIPLIMLEFDARFLDRAGRLKVVDAAAWDEVPYDDLRVWCHQRGFYGLPTTETIDWLREFIGDRSAIEVGSGNGVFGRALGVPLTDSRIQDEIEVKMTYMLQRQPTVPYGRDVEKLEALLAVQKYKPQVVFGSWVTNWVDTNKPFIAGGGCMYGLREDLILAEPSVEAYVVIGNEVVHAKKPIMKLPHETIRAPWIRSRSKDPDANAIFVWRGSNHPDTA